MGFEAADWKLYLRVALRLAGAIELGASTTNGRNGVYWGNPFGGPGFWWQNNRTRIILHQDLRELESFLS